MRRLLHGLVVITLLVTNASGNQRQETSRQRAVVFSHVTVIDATGAPPKPDMTVVAKGDRITVVGPASKTRIPRRARVINARGKYLIPGLWDMHVHLSEAGQWSLPLFIANGITSVRDMGTPLASIKQYREAMREGRITGPRIKAAGAMLTNPRVWDFIQKNAPPEIAAQEGARRLRIETPDQARKAVNDLARAGADFIKLHWNNTRETYFALADEARRAGITFAGHDPLGGLTLAEISDAGQRSIEHLDGSFAVQLRAMEEHARKELYARFVRNGTSMVPTIALLEVLAKLNSVKGVEARLNVALADHRAKYVSPSLKDFWHFFLLLTPVLPEAAAFKPAEQYLSEMHRAGVRVMPGTDIGVPTVFPGFSLHEEVKQLVARVGMTPMEALQSATLRPAEFFGLQDSLGTAEPGKIADLVLLDASPLDDISNTQRVYAVMVNGRLLDRKTLDSLLAQVEEKHRTK
jgi:imidazolonepropionase-like amidohydrolase